MKRELTFYQTASQNLILIHHLREVTERLKKTGPEIIFFRGISLLGDVYPALGDRPMLDADILVRERDVEQLKDILRGLGWGEAEPGVFDSNGLSLDLHTSFLTPIRTVLANACLKVSMDEVFQRGIIKQLDVIEIKIPCPEHLFISTAIHLQSHSFGSEKGWEDLVRIKEHYWLSDEAIRTEAKRMGAEHTLNYLSCLRPDIFPSWRKKLSLGEQCIIKRIKKGTMNPNFGDLLFLFQSKRKGKAMQEIFFPNGFSLRIIGDRLWKCLRLLKDTLT
ncbi:MAG: nucleotidyltransferase family protein [Deltaproteobacteria bacterium]|nr:nucleotidyltransferase family protein [Deltaproteobacteria bacterium]